MFSCFDFAGCGPEQGIIRTSFSVESQRFGLKENPLRITCLFGGKKESSGPENTEDASKKVNLVYIPFKCINQRSNHLRAFLSL
jgi:hypothetical protein